MARMYVESWAPEYGASVLHDSELIPTDGMVDPEVEQVQWSAVRPPADCVAEVGEVGFVDGVRRVDARLSVDDGHTIVPGLFGSLAVGATHWDRTVPRATFGEVRTERLALIAAGRSDVVPSAGLGYQSVAVPSDDPGELVRQLHERMRVAEAELAAALADRGCPIVVADGPVNSLKARSIVGLIKTHRVNYLAEPQLDAVRTLAAGDRTPLFLLDGARFARYSWYVKLAEVPGGHLWSGVCRCEVAAAVGLDRAVALADCSAVLLPTAAPALHTDPRAPQNLVPIAALEKRLRRELGDARLVYRALRQAAAEGTP